jgi:phenylacetate-CoA ligase
MRRWWWWFRTGSSPDHTLEVIRQNFYQRAPRSVNVRVEVRDTPHRLANGKAPVFISNLARA